MKRQNFDASTYTDYIKKRTNTALVQSGNFKDKKSITSTPPSIRDTLSVSLLTEFEAPIVVQPVIPEPPPPPIPSVVTIIDDIPIGGNSEDYGGDYYTGSSMTITWNCIPPSEVTLQLYGAKLGTEFPFTVVESYTIRETIVTADTSHTFNLSGYGNNNDGMNSPGTSMYVVISPYVGLPVSGRKVSLLAGG